MRSSANRRFRHVVCSRRRYGSHTDGSRPAAKAVKAGVKLAKALGAKATVIYVIPRYIPPVFAEAAVYVPEITLEAWQGILRVARSKKCDAIVMASHGRGGLGGLILGSETARVLAHSKIPVLVLR